MQLKDYVNIIRRQWWIIALVAVAGVVSAYGFSKLQTPMYRSRAAYVVRFNRLDTGGNMFANSIYNGFVNLIYTPDQMQIISDRLKLDMPGMQLMEYVRLQPQPNDSLIVIEADYFDPTTASDLVNTVGQQLNALVVEENRNLQGEDRVSLRLRPAQQAWLAKPMTRINMLAGGILGLILGALLGMVLEYADNTLKSSEDIERYVQLVTVGLIPGGTDTASRTRPRLRVGTPSRSSAGERSA
ncbi:MAG TPA: Wzz/FepE/Etk N-terminal domain-containing protein [Herpetosiphonaceae bacterium]